MLRHVAHVRTDVSEEPSASFIRVTRIGELGTTLAATSNRQTLRRNTSSVRRLLVASSVVPSSPIFVTLMKEALGSSETSVLTRPHGITSQKTPFFRYILIGACCHLVDNCIRSQWSINSLLNELYPYSHTCSPCLLLLPSMKAILKGNRMHSQQTWKRS
jgi:hypothetical protein